MFNRFYQPDIDIRTMTPTPRVELSTSAELLLRLRWLAILHGRVRPTLVVTGGVATRRRHQGDSGGRRRRADGVGTVVSMSAKIR